MTEPTSKRLDRIEEKLDKMGDVLISLARFEEKMDAYNEYRERSWDRMNKFSEKLDKIEKKVDDNWAEECSFLLRAIPDLITLPLRQVFQSRLQTWRQAGL